MTVEPFDPTESVRLAVLGVGNIGKVHVQAARAMDDVELVAVADAVPENRAYANRVGVDVVYDDYANLLRTEPVDAVVVALPPFLHRDAVEHAARRDCHVFVEKPLARTASETRDLLETATAADVLVGVDHTLRYIPAVRRVRDEYATGAVGDVPYATIARVNYGSFARPPARGPLPGWHLDGDAAGGGVLVELGVHLFDVLAWTFGDLEVLAADMDSQIDVPVEDSATVLLRATETDTRITLHCGSYQWEDDDEFNLTFRLEGLTGTLDADEHLPDSFYGNAAKSAVSNVARRLAGREPEYFGPTYYLGAYYAALRDFLDAVRAGETPPVDGHDGLRAVELAEAAYGRAERPRQPPEVPR